MNETNRFETFWRWDRIPDFRQAVRIAGCVDYKEETQGQQIHRYEYEAAGQKRNQRRSVMFAILQKLFFAVLSKRFPGMLTLSEAIGGIGRLLADAVHILGRKSSAYFNHWEQIPLKQHKIYPVTDVNKTEIVAELMRLEEVCFLMSG